MSATSDFFNEFSDKVSCQNAGMCSVDPSSYALEELLLNEIKQIAFYMVKLADHPDYCKNNADILKATVRALSVIIVNTAIRLEDYCALLYNLEKEKGKIKELYLNCCAEKNIKYELIENAVKLPQKPTLTNLLRVGETIVIEKQKEYEPKKLGLIELVIIFAKTTSINLEKLNQLGLSNEEWNFKTLKFLNLTNLSSIKIEKLKEKICNFSEFAYEIWKTLISKLEERYGKRTDTDINLRIKEGKAILVSGSDLFELEKLLDFLEGTDINVYTNSALFTAFCYPHFLKYKNLIGHFGGENAQNDFTKFKGPIFITQNFLQNIDYLRRGTIYTTKIIAPDKTLRINDYNFTPLINSALNSKGFSSKHAKENRKIPLKYDTGEIDTTLANSLDKEITVIIGSYKNDEIINRFTGSAIIELESPVEVELLIYILEHTNPEKATLVFTHCGPNTINILLSTLNKNPKKIYFAKCPNSLINPHVVRALTEIFDIETI